MNFSVRDLGLGIMCCGLGVWVGWVYVYTPITKFLIMLFFLLIIWCGLPVCANDIRCLIVAELGSHFIGHSLLS